MSKKEKSHELNGHIMGSGDTGSWVGRKSNIIPLDWTGGVAAREITWY